MNLRLRIATILSLLVLVSLTAAQPNPPSLASPGQDDSRALADDLARRDMSAGLILRLGNAETNRAGFRVWNQSAGMTSQSPGVEGRKTAEGVLHNYIERRALSAAVEGDGASGPPVLVMQRTASCRAALDRRLPQQVTGVGLIETIAKAARGVGAAVPGGFVGSCIPEAAHVALVFQQGLSLKEALQQAAGMAPGTVWVAVQDDNGACSLGVVIKSVNGGTCSASVTDGLPRGR